MLRACLGCGRPSPNPRCPNCTPANATSWAGNRDRTKQARFRRNVLARDNHQCVDCGSTQDLRACHILPLHLGGSYDTTNGVTRCRTCDKHTDRHAR